jgi:gliding motility-associated-like protein
MLNKIVSVLIIMTLFVLPSFSQAVNVTDISATGHFDPNLPLPAGPGCNLGLPTVSVQYLNGTGTSLVGGVIVCNDPCGSTTIRVTLGNVRWAQTSTVNWIHGISFTPGNVSVSVPVGVPGALPAGWAPFNTSTGQCVGGLTTGVGFYFDGANTHNCAICDGFPANDGIPGNNYGDGSAACGTVYNFFFDLTFCNSSISTDPLLFSARGTADNKTGCWSIVDPIGTSKIQFVVATQPCTLPVFTTLPNATVPTKTCSAGTGTVNYTSTLTAECGSGSQTTWWSAATGGTLLGTGSTFVYDPVGTTCPAGSTIYASCCPIGNTCNARRAFLIPGACTPALDITNVNKTDPTCVVPTGSINSVTTTGASGALTYVLNPGGITNTTGIFTGLTGTNYTLTATDAGGCSKQVPVTFTASGTGGTAPIVPNPTATYCQGQTNPAIAQLVANTTTAGATLTWYLPGSVTGVTTAPTPSVTTAGTFVYNVTQTVGTCVSAQVPITITVNPTPAVPTANTPINYCQNAISTALVATGAVGATLKWYADATTTIALAGAPIPSTASVGTTSYYVSQTVGSCEGPRKQIDVIVAANPAAPTVPSATITYCQNSTSSVLTAGGINLKWYADASTSTALPGAPTPSTATLGNTTYYVSQSSAATSPFCESARTAITVTIIAIPMAPTVIASTINYCQGNTASVLTANGINLKWYANATTLTPLAGGAPTPSTVLPGATTYYVSQSSASSVGVPACESSKTAITVNIIAKPSVPSVAAISPSYCQNDLNPVPLAVTSGSNLLWYTALTGVSGSTTAPIPSTTVVGSTTYYVSQSTTASTGVPACESDKASIIVSVIEKPNNPTVISPLTYCQDKPALALTATGSILLWYNSATTGTGTAILIPSTATTGATSYYVSQTVGGCKSDRATLIVNVSPALTANAGSNITIAGGASTQLNGTATLGADYTWTPNVPISISNVKVLNPIVNPTQTTTYKLTVADLSGACDSKDAFVTVTVVQSCVKVRNSFTPNGDGINDKWLVYDQNFCLANTNGASVTVFNRYGSKVFESKNYTNDWEGTFKGNPLPDGTYYAVIEFTYFDGKKDYKRTDLTIIR